MASQKLWSFGSTVSYANNKAGARAIIVSPVTGSVGGTRGANKIRGQRSSRAPGSKR